MKFAIVKIGKSQYKVAEGDQLLIDYISSAKEGEKRQESNVLLIANNSDLLLGKPYIEGAKIDLKVLGEKKGTKIRVSTYKAKARQRKTVGLRPIYTQVLVEKISENLKTKINKKDQVKEKKITF